MNNYKWCYMRDEEDGERIIEIHRSKEECKKRQKTEGAGVYFLARIDDRTVSWSTSSND